MHSWRLLELDEIIGLQHHVVELEERQFLLRDRGPLLHRIEREHSVDREIPADVTQEVDVVELVQPVGIVAHDGIARLAEFEKLREDGADALEIFADGLIAQHAAAFILAGRVADPGGAPAHQRDRPVAGLLQPIEHHDRQQRADVKRRRGAIESDIGGDRARLARERIERLRLRDLVDETPARRER